MFSSTTTELSINLENASASPPRTMVLIDPPLALIARNPGLKEAQFRTIIKPLLDQQGLSPEQAAALLQPLGELMTTLRDVKLADVTFLELQPYDDQTWTRDSYNDAIVSIFTRLNTAGRTLTREEITLAWLKVGWDTTLTAGKTAGECFADLSKTIADHGLTLETDELVSAASFIWAVAHNDGHLLANSDLLKGTVIRPMASDRKSVVLGK